MQPFIVSMQLEMLHLLSYNTICKIGSWSNTLVLYMDDRFYFLTLLATGHGLFTHTHAHAHAYTHTL